MSKYRTNLDMNDLAIDEKGPIWVVNTSSSVHKASGGADVFITLVLNNNQSTVMTVQKTWLPVCLTARFPRKAIMESNYFWQAVSANMVQIIAEDEAKEILGRRGSKEEAQRLRDVEEAVRNATRSKGISKNTTVSSYGDDENGDQIVPTPGVQQTQSPKRSTVVALNQDADDDFADDDSGDSDNSISIAFQAWVLKLNTQTEAEAVMEARSRGEITEEEARFLHDKTEHAKLKKMAAKAIASMQG